MAKEFHQYDHQFLKIEIGNDNGLNLPPSELYLANYWVKEVFNHISILDRNYVPLGWSQSQLRTSSLWFICEKLKGPAISRNEILSFLG